jgi:hypothetical protein
MKKFFCLSFLILFLAAGLLAVDYSYKFFTPEKYDVNIEIPSALKADSDMEALKNIQTTLDKGSLTMDVGRVGSSFNVNYAIIREYHLEVIERGDTAKTTGMFQLMNESGQTLGEWELDLCWPSKITGPSVKTEQGEHPITTVVMSFENANRIK